jgi:hypothetical protein
MASRDERSTSPFVYGLLRVDVEDVIMLWTRRTVSLEQADNSARAGNKPAIVAHPCKDDLHEHPPSLSVAEGNGTRAQPN